MGAMIAGAVCAAYLRTAFVHRISEQLLEQIILVLLVVVGTGLIVEAFLPQEVAGLLPDALPVRMVAALLFGLGIGLVSTPASKLLTIGLTLPKRSRRWG
jgi:cytochrome c biogenesis protein CcdA